MLIVAEVQLVQEVQPQYLQKHLEAELLFLARQLIQIHLVIHNFLLPAIAPHLIQQLTFMQFQM